MASMVVTRSLRCARMGNTAAKDAEREWRRVAMDADAVQKTEAIVRRLIPHARFRHESVSCHAADTLPPQPWCDV